MAKEVGANALGIILTGMGRDGSGALLRMRQAGARTLGQDEDSCIVYGMPQKAFELGAVEKEVSLARMPSTIIATLAKMKGKLPLPVSGRLENLYNRAKQNGQGRWRGAWIRPSQNQAEVKSVAAGHVVYADWLLGYGLLTIIDHGEGYFTLYGHNQSLLRAPGDYVGPGSLIAVIHQDEATAQGAYFEIRKNGQALNPADWLQQARNR